MLGRVQAHRRESDKDYRKQKHQDHSQVWKPNDAPGEVVSVGTTLSLEQAETKE